MSKIHKIIAAFFFVLVCSSAQLSAASYSLAIGERTVIVKVSAACKFQKTGLYSYKCTFKTKRNKTGGSFDERTEIIVSAEPVSEERVLDFGTEVAAKPGSEPAHASAVSLAEASQTCILSVDHELFRQLPVMSLINQLDDGNSMVVSKNERFGGSDCRIYSTAIAVTYTDGSVEGMERVGERCILWSYSNPRSESVTALDLLIEVREIADYNPQGSPEFTRFAMKVVSDPKFK